MKLQAKEKTKNLNNTIFGKEILNESEVANYLNISKKKLQKDRLRKEGIPYCKFGSSVRYQVLDIHNYINQTRVDLDARY